MANISAPPLVNAKLYRHFATVTFAITLCVALFANGEARQIVSDRAVQEQQANDLQKAQVAKFGVKQIGDRRSSIGTRGGFGEEYDPTYGLGLAGGGPANETRSISSPGASSFRGSDLAGPAAAKLLSPDEMARLTPEQQSAYVKKLRTQSAPKRTEEVRDLAAIAAGSRARSGSRTID